MNITLFGAPVPFCMLEAIGLIPLRPPGEQFAALQGWQVPIWLIRWAEKENGGRYP